MTIILASLVTIGIIAFIFTIRTKDLPEPEPVSPFFHLDERKAAIYENLRDLQFEFRVGKLSDADYQHTKQDLQRDLAGVMAEIDQLKAALAKNPGALPAPPVKADPPAAAQFVCPHCKAEFAQALKFCGECGKPMKAARA